MSIENRRDCGGPPQTRRSRWSEQHDETDIARGPIEVGSKDLDGVRRELDERRLTIWCVVRAELLSPERGRQGHRDR